MMGSRMCWQLLLMWALLLGQPVRGMEEGQEPPSEQGDVDQSEESEEELERIASNQRSSMMAAGAYDRWAEHFGDVALDFYNRKGNMNFYKSVERNVTIKKAIGNIIHIGLYLAKTSCTKEEVLYRQVFLHDRDIISDIESMNQPRPELNPCDLPPESAQENLECRFNIFSEKKNYWEAVVGHMCTPLQTIPDW